MRRLRAVATLFCLAPLVPIVLAASGAAGSTGGVVKPGLVGLTSTRVLDTRIGLGAAKGPVGAGRVLELKVAGAGGVPASGAAAVMVNLTAMGASAAGSVTAYPSGQPRPLSLNLSYGKGRTVANEAIVQVGTGGRIALYTSASAHLLVDVSAYYPSGSAYVPVTPARLLDTRTRPGATTRVAAATAVGVPVLGVGGIPASGVGAVVLDVTDTASVTGGYVTTYPRGTPRPGTSSLSYTAGATVTGMVVAKPGSGGAVDVYTSASSHLVVDVSGYFPADGADYVPVTPTRAVDTRYGVGAPRAKVAAGGSVVVSLDGKAGLPAADSDAPALAVQITVTAVGPGAAGYLVAFPTGTARPGTSTVNFAKGETRANSTTVLVPRNGPSAGKLTVWSTAQTELVLDVSGYFRSPTTQPAVEPAPEPTPEPTPPPGGYAQIATTSLPQADVGERYTARLTTVDQRPGTWSISAGTLPRGLRIDGDTIRGVAAGGSSEFTVTFDDGSAPTSARLAIDVHGDDGPTAPSSRVVVQISAGLHYNCAVLSDSTTACWGARRDYYEQTGHVIDSETPKRPFGLRAGVASVTAGAYHACALMKDSSARCWGFNPQGQLGDGTTSTAQFPVEVSALGDQVASISAGSDHTCAVTTDGAAKCWGFNGYGQLGDGTTDNHSLPTQVRGLTSGVVSISAGVRHTCAVLSDGTATCWGDNDMGQLGNGTTVDSLVPTRVAGPTSGVASVSAGYGHTCAVLVNGGARCWGVNGGGQLGDGTYDSSTTPVAVVGASPGVKSISVSNAHTCAVLTDGAAVCWGDNTYTDLGDYNAGSASNTPVQVYGLETGVSSITAGSTYHSCAATDDGAAKCWGFDYYAETGGGNPSQRSGPIVQVQGLDGAVPG